MKILIVDDEKIIVKGLKFSFEQDGVEVDCAYDGQEALDKLKSSDYDIVLLDLMLPVVSGIDVCRKVREYSTVPIIMLTAKGEYEDIIFGLDCGADDYITKPFNVDEVKARMNAILRRVNIKNDKAEENDILETGDIRLELNNRRMFIKGVEYNLTSKEFELMALLCSNPKVIFPREKLLNLVWGNDYPGDERTVDVHIRRLREKIEPNPGEPTYVHTKWGVGYYYE